MKNISFSNFVYATVFMLMTSVSLQAETTLVVTDSSEISGKVTYVTGVSMEGVEVTLSGFVDATTYTDANGDYSFDGLPNGYDYSVSFNKAGDQLNGISVIDLILLREMILSTGVVFLPYNILAADANGSQTISTFDIVIITKVILGLDTFTDNWGFTYTYSQFPNPLNPFSSTIAIHGSMDVSDLQNDVSNIDFTGYKMGDFNQDADPNE